MKKLMTAVLAVCPKILAGGGQAGVASLRQCLLHLFLAARNGSETQSAQSPRLTAAEVSRPHTRRLPAVAAGSSATARSESGGQGW